MIFVLPKTDFYHIVLFVITAILLSIKMTTLELKKNSMESLNALFVYATEGIIIANKKGVIIKANPSSEKTFGYNSAELNGKLVEELIPTRFVKNHEAHREKYNSNPHARSMGSGMNLFGKRKDNSEFPLEISLSHYRQDEEQYVIAFIIDITERKEAEDNIKKVITDLEYKFEERTKILKETLIELESSKEELSKALEKEKELNDMKSRFVSMASHEFRTPLSTILSSVSLIGKYQLTEDIDKRKRHVDRIKSAVTNMTFILNDFLSVGKLEEGKISNNPSFFNVKDFITEILTELNSLKKIGQTIEYVHLGNENCFIDKQILRNVIINLVSNAIKFSSENKNILINTILEFNQFSISVTDNGIGIPNEEKNKLFNRFFRAKNALNIQGTGLGLNIVSKYIEALGGTISFESELEKGTTFFITIPTTINE